MSILMEFTFSFIVVLSVQSVFILSLAIALLPIHQQTTETNVTMEITIANIDQIQDIFFVIVPMHMYIITE